jgi:hypothetical protein
MTNDDYNLNNTQRRTVRRYLGHATDLPPHPETWACFDVALPQRVLSAFSRHGVINSMGKIPAGEHPGGSGDVHRWQTAPDITAYVDRYLAGVTMTPCGCSTGIRTIQSGETFTCRNTECNRTFDRPTALAVANNDPLRTEQQDGERVVADGGTTCPDCGGVLAHRAGCTTCLSCGYSSCGGAER